MPRKKKFPQDMYSPSQEERDAMSWCIDRKIRIYPEPVGNEYKLVVEYPENGQIKTKVSPKTYPRDNYASTMWKLYLYHYQKLVDKLA